MAYGRDREQLTIAWHPKKKACVHLPLLGHTPRYILLLPFGVIRYAIAPYKDRKSSKAPIPISLLSTYSDAETIHYLNTVGNSLRVSNQWIRPLLWAVLILHKYSINLTPYQTSKHDPLTLAILHA